MKKTLETTFDTPFEVKTYSDAFWIAPENKYDELFQISIKLQSGVRIIAEATPQNHAGNMLEDFSNSSKEQRILFQNYLNNLKENSKLEFEVNGNHLDFSLDWPKKWKYFKVRTTKIIPENEPFIEIAKQYAINMCGMFLSLLKIVPIDNGYEEGSKYQILSTRYERNPLNRELCLSKYGYSCKICGFNFKEKYGEIGKNFIHVHHITPVSKMGEGYVVDPLKDMIPVCPNCHAMLHTKNPPLVPEELREIIKDVNK